jgi:hypothetical protein
LLHFRTPRLRPKCFIPEAEAGTRTRRGLARVSLELQQEIGAITTSMAAMNKCLALGDKSSPGREATNKRDTRPALIPLEMCLMKPTFKIRFTEPQIALVLHVHADGTAHQHHDDGASAAETHCMLRR